MLRVACVLRSIEVLPDMSLASEHAKRNNCGLAWGGSWKGFPSWIYVWEFAGCCFEYFLWTLSLGGRRSQCGGSMPYTMALHVRVLLLLECVCAVGGLHFSYNHMQRQMPWLKHWWRMQWDVICMVICKFRESIGFWMCTLLPKTLVSWSPSLFAEVHLRVLWNRQYYIVLMVRLCAHALKHHCWLCITSWAAEWLCCLASIIELEMNVMWGSQTRWI